MIQQDLVHFFEDGTKITFWDLPTFKVRTRQGTERLLWVEIIQKYVGNIEEFPDTWEKLVDKTPIEVVKDLALAVHQFFTSSQSRLVWSHLWSLKELNCWNLDYLNPNWHELRKQEKCSSLAPPRSIFYKTQWTWQGVKITRLMSILTSKTVWKCLIKI